MTSMPNVQSISNQFLEKIKTMDFIPVLKLVGSAGVGVLLTLYLCRIIGKVSEKKISAHHSQIIRRLVFYIGIALSIMFSLDASDIDINGLLNAAGIAAGIMTAAVAFASQTSISNFLSGVFLLAEKPFEVGDLIDVGDAIGEVLSIDLLSVKIRTRSNIFIRIPNENLLKSQFKNITRFPIRRCDLRFQINFQTDLHKIKKMLIEIAKQNPLCLVNPPPDVYVVQLGNQSILIQFSVWAKQSSYVSLETSIQMDIQNAFLRQNIPLAPLVLSDEMI